MLGGVEARRLDAARRARRHHAGERTATGRNRDHRLRSRRCKSYSIAQDLSSSGRQEESIPHYQKAIELDQNFGRAYSGLATVLFNIGRRARGDGALEEGAEADGPDDGAREVPDARVVVRRARRQLRAGDRELREAGRARIRRIAPARAIWRSSYFQMLDFKKAMDHGRRAVELYPKNPRSRKNYAIYAMYAGDLKTAETEAATVLEQSKASIQGVSSARRRRVRSDPTSGACAGAYERHARHRRRRRVAGGPRAGRSRHVRRPMGRRREAARRTASPPTRKRTNRLARAAKLDRARRGASRAESYAAGRARRAGCDGDHPRRRDARAGGASSSSAPAAAPRRRPSRRSSASSFSAAAAPTARSSKARLRAAAGRVRRGEATRSIAQRSWRSLARPVPAGRDLHRGRRDRSAQAELDRPRSAAARRPPSSSTTCRRSAISRRCRTGWVARSEGINKASPAAAENYRKFLALRPEDARDPLAADARKRLAGAASPSRLTGAALRQRSR